MTEQWVRSHERGPDYVESLGGTPWHEAPLPRWWHRCAPRTRAQFAGSGNYVERCACGAARLGGDRPWLERNETRRARARARWAATWRHRGAACCRECGKPYEPGAGVALRPVKLDGSWLCAGCGQHLRSWAEAFVLFGGR